MIIIGEKLNSSVKSIRPFMEGRDCRAIAEVARQQVSAGASFIDVNAGTFMERESEVLEWLAGVVQETVNVPLSIDSPNPLAIEKVLRICRQKPLINSITAEKERWEKILPLVLEHKTAVIALCMDDQGMPETAEERFNIAAWMIENMSKKGVAMEDIYIDPMVRPIGTGTHYGVVALDTIAKIMKEFPGVHTVCGLSNISFGLPARKVVNQAFLVMAIHAGLDAAILDPLDKRLMSLLYASEALVNRDEYCMKFLTAYREGRVDDVNK